MIAFNTRPLGGFALPAVIVASVIILLLILFAYSAVTIDLHRHSLYHDRKQQREDLKSTLTLYCTDSTLCSAGDSVEVALFDGRNAVAVSVEHFGLYEKVTLSNGYPDRHRILVGKNCECDEKAAFWLCDHNRPLSIAGDARIDGPVYMPLNGINYTEVSGKFYTGKKIPESRLGISSVELPAMDPVQLGYAGKLCRYSDEVVELRYGTRDTVICGSVVKIRPGFRGSVQVFASDSVIVEGGAFMEYPSGIYVDSEDKRPYVALEKDAEVNGYVIVISRNSDIRLQHPSYVQKKGAKLQGLLYVDGPCNLEGDISGAAYVKDCFHSDGNVYAGTLYDVRIARSDSLAFPIFLKGPYRRKMIKKMH